jgi:hypothetical protein
MFNWDSSKASNNSVLFNHSGETIFFSLRKLKCQNPYLPCLPAGRQMSNEVQIPKPDKIRFIRNLSFEIAFISLEL